MAELRDRPAPPLDGRPAPETIAEMVYEELIGLQLALVAELAQLLIHNV